MLAATLVGGGTLLASQAGASAVLVATLQPPEGFDFTRSLDALVGSGTALVVGSPGPARRPGAARSRGLGPVLDRLAAALGADRRRARAPRRARGRARPADRVGRLDLLYDQLTDTLGAAGDAARISLGRRGKLGRLERYVVAVDELGLAIEDVRALARGATRAIALDDSTPPEVIAAIRELATAARELDDLLEDENADPSRGRPRCAPSGSRTPCWRETSNMSALHIVGQVRLVAVDLLRASGVPTRRGAAGGARASRAVG